MNLRPRISSLLLAIFIALLSQTVNATETSVGTISGKIVDKNTSETLIGVPVMLEGTSFGAVTDLDGNYRIENVPAENYSMLIRYIGYTSKIIPEIKVTAKAVLSVDVTMESSNLQLNEVTITADMKRESIGSILLMQKKVQLYRTEYLQNP